MIKHPRAICIAAVASIALAWAAGTASAATLLSAVTSQSITIDPTTLTLDSFDVELTVDYFGTPATAESTDFTLTSVDVPWTGSLGDFDGTFNLSIVTTSAVGNIPIGGIRVDLLKFGTSVLSDETDGFFIEKTPTPADLSGYFSNVTTFDNTLGQAEGVLFDVGTLPPGDTVDLTMDVNFPGNTDEFFPINSSWLVTFLPANTNVVPTPLAAVAGWAMFSVIAMRRRR